jgi:hypothetical protein
MTTRTISTTDPESSSTNTCDQQETQPINPIHQGIPVTIHKICHRETGELLLTIDTSMTSATDLAYNSVALQGADFSGLDLTGFTFRHSDLTGASFHGATLRNTNLSHTDCSEVDFTGADLSGAYLHSADIRGAVFGNASLNQADFSHTVMDSGTDFTGAGFCRTTFYDAQSVYDAVWPSYSYFNDWIDNAYGLSYCSGCATINSSDSGYTTADEGFRCEDCGASYCDDCDEYYADLDYHREDAHSDDDEEDYCNCGCQGGGTIRSYSYKPRWVNHGLSPVKFGFELEVVGSRHHAGLVRVADPTEEVLICKDDSSIPGGGFEIVSHPMDLDWFNGNFDHSLIPNLRQAGMRTSDGAGLHVHVSRKAFSGNFHTLSWLNLIYRNSEAMTKLARRNSDQWARFHKPAKGELPAKARPTVTSGVGTATSL